MPDQECANLDGSRVYLSIGSNAGEREGNVLQAVRRIAGFGFARLERLSSLYETEPVGCGPMRAFVNAVARFRSSAGPRDLFSGLQRLERAMGRRGGHNAPRTIDLDILTFGEEVCYTGPVVLPHPRYRERAFVLIPLREIAPDFVCPATGRGIDRLVSQLPSGQWITRIGGCGLSAVASGVRA